ncbi:MAG: penicillin-binding protein 1B [Planctomycetota bacterium]|jgi:penicillin-binding protein 1B
MPKKTKGKQAESPKTPRHWRIFRGALVILLVSLAVYIVYLNWLINQRFEGETWALPSRVYARALELYPGLELSRDRVEFEIKLANYQRVIQQPQPGQYRILGDSIELNLREFMFEDGLGPSRLIQLFYKGKSIDAIVDSLTGKPLPIIRIPPMILGSYYPNSGEDRMLLQESEIPELLKGILLAVEDRDFFAHHGVSPMAIARALIANLQAGKTVQGGSTLTQQLAKNLFLTAEKSLLRKINEAFMAIILDYRFSKQALLTAYINEVFLLQQNNIAIHGFALASRMLYQRNLDQLEVHELAMLVAMVKGPTRYNPVSHPVRAKSRRDLVLRIARDHGLIDATTYNNAIKSNIATVARLPGINRYPAYLDMVKRQMLTNYSRDDIAGGGLRIFTSFDPIAQDSLESGLAIGLKRFDSKKLQAAVIVTDYLNGDIRALIGDRNTDYPGFNRAVMAQRPVGSLIKPLLLYSLLEGGLSLASQVKDEPIRIKQSDGNIWAPRNYDRKVHGEMTLYQAFIKSYNLPFVNLGVNGGLEKLARNLEKIKLLKHEVIYPSMLLGTSPMSVFEVAQMYQVIANNGYFTPLTTIRTVTDQQFNTLSRVPFDSVKLFDEAQMMQVQRAMVGVSEQGTARYLAQRFKSKTLAAKTGTTNEARDSWFAGFTDRLLSVVWLGRDDNGPIGLTGSSGALRVWADIMDKHGFNSFKLNRNADLHWYPTNPILGGITGKNCINSVLLPFLKSQIPDYQSPCP